VFGVRYSSEGLGSKVRSAGVRVRLYLKLYREEPDDFDIQTAE